MTIFLRTVLTGFCLFWMKPKRCKSQFYNNNQKVLLKNNRFNLEPVNIHKVSLIYIFVAFIYSAIMAHLQLVFRDSSLGFR